MKGFAVLRRCEECGSPLAADAHASKRFCARTCQSQNYERRRTLRAKKKSGGGFGLPNPRFNIDRGSIQALVNVGDKDLLKKLGMTKAEAKAKLYAWKYQAQGDAAAMERWYRSEVG